MQPHKESTCLAFDCSIVGVSVALRHQGALYTRQDHSANKQAGQLLPMIDEVMREAGASYSDIVRLITTHGPGSFTGIRIGLATAQGIAAACEIEVATLTSLYALALGAAALGIEGPVWAAINAGKGEICGQLFHVKQSVVAEGNELSLFSPEAFLARPYIEAPVVGNGFTLLPEESRSSFIAALSLPRAQDFVSYQGPAQPIEALVPLYVRPPDAKLPSQPLPLE